MLFFKGEKFAHVFRIDGKYIASFRGVLSASIERYFSNKTKSELRDLDLLTGVVEIENDGGYYWVRLKDGMKYVGD